MGRVTRALLVAVLLLPLWASAATVGRADGIVLPPAPCFVLPPEPVPDLAPGPRPLPVEGIDDGGIAAGQPLPQPVPPIQATPAPLPPIPPIAPVPPIPPPIRPIVPCWLTVRYHRVNVDIVDQVATTRVDQVFANETGRPLEGTYVFPLPLDAAVSGFSMFVDGEKLDGQVLTREEARRLYESIVRQNRDPALLEYVGRGAFQANVFPVPAGGERRIQLEYTQVLTQDNGLVRYVYPLNTERFSARPLQQASVAVSIRSSGQAIRAVYSPSHEIGVTRSGDFAATASWEQANVTPRKDFELVYGLSPGEVGLHVVTHKPSATEDGYFLLLAAPPAVPAAQHVVPKDVTLVVDTSGSMAGAKMDQAKAALKYVLNRLNPQDRFNVVAFESTVRPFAAALRPASERDQALAFVETLVASGGTNIDGALQAALTGAGGEPGGITTGGQRARTVIFVTDGLPTVGPQQPDQIVTRARAAAPPGTRLFSFGVGYDVNTTLLDALAAELNGASSYVKPGDNLEEAISTFYTRVGTPVLTDLALDFGGANVYDVLPARLPDLYAGGQVVVAGRYRTPGTFDVTLRGAAVGETLRTTARGVTFAAGPASGQASLPRLWASRKIGFLLDEIRRRGADPELVDEIVTLATRYGIATPYTSIYVPEPGQPPRPGQPGQPLPTPAPLTPQSRSQAADGLRQGITSAPTSGAAAVQNSESAARLRDAATAAGAGQEGQTVQTVGDKTFVLVDGVWTDVSSGQAPPAERISVALGSDAYFALLDASPEVASYLAVGAHLMVQLGDTWYEVTE